MNMLKSLGIFLTLIFLSSLLLSLFTVNAKDGHNHAPVTNLLEGKHYHRITPAVPTNVEEGKVEVLEIFWYGCPHCFDFEPHIVSWKETMSEDVSFMRVPAVLNRGWVTHARAFYALETMGELERIHPVFFEAIHTQGRRLRDVESMARFLSQHEVDVEKFKSAYNSMYVETKIKRADQVVRQYGVSSVPQVIINGKYRTSASDAGSYENLLRVVDMLVEQESSSAAQASTAEAAAE